MSTESSEVEDVGMIQQIVGTDRLKKALDTLETLHTDTRMSGAVRSGAAKAILAAGVQLSKSKATASKRASEMTISELEQEIQRTQAKLGIVSEQ